MGNLCVERVEFQVKVAAVVLVVLAGDHDGVLPPAEKHG